MKRDVFISLTIVVLVAQSYLTLCDPMDSSLPGPPSMGFTRQQYWSGLPFPSPGDLSGPGIEPRSPTCRKTPYHLSYQGSPVSFPLNTDVYQIVLCMLKVKVKVTQLCLTLCNPVDYTVGILHARIIAWVAIPFSRGSS